MKKMGWAIVSLLLFLSPCSILAQGWKIRIGAASHHLSLADLEAPLDFWNYAIKNAIQNKNKDYGTKFPLPKEIKGVSSSKGIFLSFERKLASIFYLGFGAEVEHTSLSDSDKIEGIDETGGKAIWTFEFKDSLDCISPFLQISAYPLNLKYLGAGIFVRGLFNLLKLKGEYSTSGHLMDATGIMTRVLIKENASLDSLNFFPSYEFGAVVEIKWKFLSLAGVAGYRTGKKSPFEGDFNYFMDMQSIYHEPIHVELKESGKVWVGESRFEAGGYTYWPKSIFASKETPDPSILRNAKEAEVTLSGRFFGVSLSFIF